MMPLMSSKPAAKLQLRVDCLQYDLPGFMSPMPASSAALEKLRMFAWTVRRHRDRQVHLHDDDPCIIAVSIVTSRDTSALSALY